MSRCAHALLHSTTAWSKRKRRITSMQAELLMTADVAKLAGVTPAAVRQWAETGRLKAAVRTVSGVRLYERGEVERLIAQRRKDRATRAA